MRVLLGVTGSVATTLVGKLLIALEEQGHEVQIVTTDSSLYFFDPEDLEVKVWQDKDEWPGDEYVRNQGIPHIELRNWADLFLVAPVSANTLAKMANGFSNNLLTCVFRAWNFSKRVIIAPAMNTRMWKSPFTKVHLGQLEALQAYGLKITIVPPVKKTLACGDTGVGAMAHLDDIVHAVANYSKSDSA